MESGYEGVAWQKTNYIVAFILLEGDGNSGGILRVHWEAEITVCHNWKNPVYRVLCWG